jgi:hypothetical protein
MELVTDKLNLKIDGQPFELSYPSTRQYQSVEKLGEDIKIEQVVSFVVACGLPESQVETLQTKNLLAIFKELLKVGND